MQHDMQHEKSPPEAGVKPVHGGDFLCLLFCAAGLTFPVISYTCAVDCHLPAALAAVPYRRNGGALTLSFIVLP